MSDYKYRGVYDETELDRIGATLDKQRELFLSEEENQYSTEDKVKKYFFILAGVTTIIILTKVLTKWKRT